MINQKTENNGKLIPYRAHFSEYWRDYNKIIISFLILIGLLIVGTLVSRGYSELTHILLRFRVASYVGSIAIIQATVIMAGGGGIDVSVGTMASLGALFGSMIMQGRNEMIIPAVLAVGAFGLVLGLINGFMIAKMKIHPLIQTLAMSYVITGIIVAYAQGKMLLGKPAPLVESIANGKVGAVYIISIVFLLLVACFEFMLKSTRTGHKIMAVGTNDRTAMLSGVNVDRFRIFVYGFSGMASAAFGIILLGYVHTTNLDIGNKYMFPSVVACTVGGISLSGGSGSYIGVLGGALVYTFLQSFLVTINVGEAWRKALFGLILVSVLIIYSRSEKKK